MNHKKKKYKISYYKIHYSNKTTKNLLMIKITWIKYKIYGINLIL